MAMNRGAARSVGPGEFDRSAVPEGFAASSATVELFHHAGVVAGETCALYRATSSWEEATVTWAWAWGWGWASIPRPSPA